MSSLNIALLLLELAAAVCAAAGAAPHNYKAFEVEGCLQNTLVKHCRTTGALVDVYNNPLIPSGGTWWSEFTCCNEKHKPTKGHRTDDLASFTANKARVATCEWNVEIHKELDGGYEAIMPVKEDGILKVGDAWGVCRINAKAAGCEGQAFCEDGMTLTIQGGFYVTAAYSEEPGNKMATKKGDLCHSQEFFNDYNNLFACSAGSGPDEQVQTEWLMAAQRKSAPRNKTSTASGGNDKNKIRRLLQDRQDTGETSSYILVDAMFAAVVSTGYYDEALKTLGVTDGGPVACSPGTGAPISGGPYGGLAYSIAGTATVSTESGKFEEVGRVEFTPFFVAVGQKLKATQDLPWVKGGGLKMYLKVKDE